MEIDIFSMNGVPMVDTITIANVCRNGKTNNVYRMAKHLAEIGEPGIIDQGGRPAKCAMSQSAFQRLATRFYRHKDEQTALGVVAINNAFNQFMDTIIDDVSAEVHKNQETAADIADVEFETVAFEDASFEMKVGTRITRFIEETKRRMAQFNEVMFDALRDVAKDIMEDFTNENIKSYNEGMKAKQAECDALRSKLDALRRMMQPEPTADQVTTLAGNVSVQQCAAWLTSNGIKDMGEIRLYEWMRSNGLVCSVGTSRNLPTQIALEKGLLVTESNPYRNPRTGEMVNSYTTRVTPKGQKYVFNRLMYYQINPKK